MKNLIFVISFITYALARMGNSIDVSSYGNIEEVRTEHVHLNLTVDFDKEQFSGYAVHTLWALQDDIDGVYFDVVGMNITSIKQSDSPTPGAGNESTPAYNMTLVNPKLGYALGVTFAEKTVKGNTYYLHIYYNTNNETTSISWLTPAQTVGKKMPYLYTQCEDVACRSLAPLQDTPANKFTYTAAITVDQGFNVKMSANDTKQTNDTTTNTTTYEFECAIHIQSYLIAIAVGDIVEKNVGHGNNNATMVNVITEPDYMPNVTAEFGGLGEVFQSVENLFPNNPYPWGNYTILVLPPSFPMGGMENPLLTFASPTVIVGDKSQVYVAAHEMAHSWTGNTVTCADWSNFWLNEGFTVYFERRSAIDRDGDEISALENAFIGNQSSYNNMMGYGYWNSYSSLHPNVREDLPDNSFSEIPYEKGFQFLWYLDKHVIGREKLTTLIDTYITANAFKSIKWRVFQAHVDDFIDANWDKTEAARLKGMINWEDWVYVPGLAPVHLDFTTKGLNDSMALVDKFITNTTVEADAKKVWAELKDTTKTIFLQQFNTIFNGPNGTNIMTAAIFSQIDSYFDVTNEINPEIKQQWQPLGILLGLGTTVEPAHTTVSTVGRMKYLTPIYDALLKTTHPVIMTDGTTKSGLEVAKMWYQENYDFYSPYAQVQLGKLIDTYNENASVEQPEPTFLSF